MPDNKYKNAWSGYFLVLVFYSCLTSAFYAAFSYPESGFLVYFEVFVEICFGIDIFLTFFSAYVDEELNITVDDLKLIAIHYIKSWFFIDVLAIFPFRFITSDKGSLFKLVRILRVSRFLKIFDESKVNSLLEAILYNISTQDKMKYLYVAKYVYKIIRLLLLAITLTYFLGCFWYILISLSCNEEFRDSRCFYYAYALEEKSNFHALVLCCYFILTTLATVGYGDYSPKSDLEKIIGIFIMIMGIAFFSYIMSNFTDILVTYDQKMGIVDYSSDLQVWLTSLSKFSSKPLQKDIVSKIYEHFQYYWKNHRLSSISEDDQYFSLLPDSLKKTMIKHLFQDIFYQKFRTFFLIKGKECSDYNFYIDMAFALLPRKYAPKEQIFQRFEEIQEIHFILEGQIELTFTYNDMEIKNYFDKDYYFGDYNILSDKKAEFNYQAITSVKTYVLQKQKFLEILEKYEDMKQHIISKSFNLYHQTSKGMINTFCKTLNQNNEKISQSEAAKIFKQTIQVSPSQKNDGDQNIFNFLLKNVGVQSKKIAKEELKEISTNLSNLAHKLKESQEFTIFDQII